MRYEGVRLMEPDDEESLMALLRENHAENGMGTPLDEDKVRAFIHRSVDRTGGLIGVIPGPNGLEGSIGMSMEQLWWCDLWWLVEKWIFVRPDCRRTTHAKRLIGFAKWASESVHLPAFIGIVSDARTEAKVRLYKRQLPFTGAYFLYRPQGVTHGW